MAVRSVDDANDLLVALVAWAERHEPGQPAPVPVQHVVYYQAPPTPRPHGG
jgi:hypothetical protein